MYRYGKVGAITSNFASIRTGKYGYVSVCNPGERQFRTFVVFPERCIGQTSPPTSHRRAERELTTNLFIKTEKENNVCNF